MLLDRTDCWLQTWKYSEHTHFMRMIHISYSQLFFDLHLHTSHKPFCHTMSTPCVPNVTLLHIAMQCAYISLVAAHMYPWLRITELYGQGFVFYGWITYVDISLGVLHSHNMTGVSTNSLTNFIILLQGNRQMGFYKWMDYLPVPFPSKRIY